MEKKQFVIIPPMSATLQKLSVIMGDITEEENIEISIIDDIKEATQFLSATGQCLMIFSDAKKCATFLQTNKQLILKNRSKALLLVPKELPEKTLSKFVKIGLTEAILDTTAPKTLVYKVKLMLKSIKTTTRQIDNKNELKNNANLSQEMAPQTTYKSTDDNVTDVLKEELEKSKSNSEDEFGYNYGKLKSNKSEEEATETHWKSERSKYNDLVEDVPDINKINGGEASEIETYMKGKSKKSTFELELEESEAAIKKSNYDEEDNLISKKKKQFNLELEAESAEDRNNGLHEEEDELRLGKKKKNLILEVEKEQNTNIELELTEEEKKAKLRLELEELDALIANAKKRLALELIEEDEDKKSNIALDIEEAASSNFNDDIEDEMTKKKTKSKSLVLDLLDGPEESKFQEEEEELAKQARKPKLILDLEEEISPEDDSIEKAEIKKKHKMKRDFDLQLEEDEVETKNEELEDFALKSKKQKRLDLEFLDEDNVNTNTLVEEENPDEDNISDLENPELVAPDRAVTNLDLLDENQQDADEDLKNPEPKEAKKRKLTKLEFAEEDENPQDSDLEDANDDKSRPKKSLDNLVDQENSARRIKKKELELEASTAQKEEKKIEHNWDNLNLKNSKNLQLEKGNDNKELHIANLGKNSLGEITIDYRLLREEFNERPSADHLSDFDENLLNTSKASTDTEDEDGSFKVILPDARGFDFGINIINLLYQKDAKPEDFFKMVAEELITKYKSYAIFYSYKSIANEHTIAFDSFQHYGQRLVSDEIKQWAANTKLEENKMTDYFSKSMPTWLCRDIADKSGIADKYWEDVELPQWAANELTSKKVELIFPYYDGVDRMGVAILYFPEGLSVSIEKPLFTVMEMLRSMFLDTIQRKSNIGNKSAENSNDSAEKNKILSMFSGLFNRKKAG